MPSIKELQDMPALTVNLISSFPISSTLLHVLKINEAVEPRLTCVSILSHFKLETIGGSF